MNTALVNIDWLHQNINDPDLVILDGSPVSNKANMKVKHPGIRIVGARQFDLKNTFSDQESNLPNMVPSAAVFTEECQKIGINANSKIVIYDNLEIYSSPRAWWLFKIMGHKNVAVLNGGLNEWLATDGMTEAITEQTFSKGDFVADFAPKSIKNANQLLANIDSKEAIVVDARSAGRFNSEAPEPRVNARSGHIPGSCNVPFSKLTKGGRFLPKEALKVIFDEMNLGNKPLVFSCGSGMTACVTLLAASLVLENDLALYDASWSEWGDGDAEFPVK